MSGSDSLTEGQMRALLNERIEAAGGVMAWCRIVGLSHAPVSLARDGSRCIPESVANACGFIRETRFRRIDNV